MLCVRAMSCVARTVLAVNKSRAPDTDAAFHSELSLIIASNSDHPLGYAIPCALHARADACAGCKRTHGYVSIVARRDIVEKMLRVDDDIVEKVRIGAHPVGARDGLTAAFADATRGDGIAHVRDASWTRVRGVVRAGVASGARIRVECAA